MTLKVGDIVWVNGITTRYAGTQHPNSYYLPIKARIGWIAIYRWGRVYHVNPLHKSKQYRGLETTNLANHFGGGSHEISKSWKKVKRISDSFNRGVRRHKNENKSVNKHGIK